MLLVEKEICAALYGLYLIECLHWLKPDECAAVRTIGGDWRLHKHTEESYALLGRMPVMVNPLDLRPSYARVPPAVNGESMGDAMQELLHEKLPRVWLLTAFSIFGAVNLFVFLPVFLSLSFLTGLLRLWAYWAVITHIGLGVEMFFQAKHWRQADRGWFWREYIAMLLNPTAALRCGDILLRATSELAWLRAVPEAELKVEGASKVDSKPRRKRKAGKKR